MSCPRRVSRSQSRHAVPSTDGIGRDGNAQRTESKRKGREERGCLVVPVVDELERVTDNLTTKGDASTRLGTENTDKFC